MPYKYGSQKCDLCLPEKVAIVRFEGFGLLNNELSFYVNVEIEINLS